MNLKILALTRYSRRGASSRLRFEQFVPELLNFGIDVEISVLLRDEYLDRLYAGKGKSSGQVLSDYYQRLIVLMSARRYDLLWIEKELFPELPYWFEWLLVKCGVRYIVDYDDAVFHNYDLSANTWRRLLSNKIDCVMRNSSLVVCGNAYLAERAKNSGANKVEIIPTVIDLNRYSVFLKHPSDPLVIGWIGTAATVKYLDIVIPALRLLSKEFPIQLRVIGASFEASGLSVDCRPWSEKDEVQQIQEFDVGIMPLLDSPWERGKCGYKLIQYMACGVPVVASPTGVNAEIVEHDGTGYLAVETIAWLDSLRSLAANSNLRRKFGLRGRALVEERYCLQVAAPRLASLLKVACGQR